MKHIFIVNPVAGKGKTLNIIPVINKYFEQKPKDTCEIVLTEGPGHAIKIARAVTSQGTGRVYSVGGDGTLNEVLNGMIHSDFSLGVIPMGSGNDFIKTLCPTLSKDYNPEDIENIIEGHEKTIDCAKADNKYFINVASVGFDAEVAQNTLHFKHLPLIPGSLAYILSIFYTVIRNKPIKITYTIDDKKISNDQLLIAICNGKFYGGGFIPAPNADMSDGLLDICSVDFIRILKILKCFPRLKKGTHTSMDEVKMYKSNHLTIESDKEFCLNLDGEISKVNKVNFDIVRKGLKIIIPKNV